MSVTAPQKHIAAGNAFRVRQQLQTLDDNGRWVKFEAGAPTVAIAHGPNASPTYGPAPASYNDAGELVAVISSANVDAALGSLADGAIAYLIVTAGASGEYRGVTPLRVVRTRLVP